MDDAAPALTCSSRIARGKVLFGNNKNYFYVEGVCGRPVATSGYIMCEACSHKSRACRIMESRQFDHGLITEPIPYHSHIYGGKWYEEAVKKFGEPAPDMLKLASAACEHIKDMAGNIIMKRPATGVAKIGGGSASAVVPAQINQTIYVDFIEDEEIIDIDDVVNIHCERCIINDKIYMRDTDTNCLYIIYGNGGMGACNGRWNDTTKLIEPVDEDD